jgi:hypothetical protein
MHQTINTTQSYSAIALFALLITAGELAAQELATSVRSFWNHNGSTIYLVADKSSREFYYDEPRPGMVMAGARSGNLLFRGKSIGNEYVGTAFIFDSRCGNRSYNVSGPILDNSQRVLLRGRAPRVGQDCQPRGYVDDTHQFTFLGKTTPALSSRPLSASFAGVWIESGEKDNLCKAGDWEARGSGSDPENRRRLSKVTSRSVEGWEFECNITDANGSKANDSERENAELSLTCSGEAMTWKSKQLWSVQTIDGRKTLLVARLKILDLRDDAGKLVKDDQASDVSISSYLHCN